MRALKSILLATIALSIASMLMSLAYFHTIELTRSATRLYEKEELNHQNEKDYFSFGGSASNHHPRGRLFFDNTAGNATAASLNASTERRNDTSSCFPFNSNAWLNAERLGNLQDPRMDETFISTLFDGMSSLFQPSSNGAVVQGLLKQTLCHEDSNFLSIDGSMEDMEGRPTNATIHAWSVRLIFLAAHLHQHLPALQEAKARLQRSSSRLVPDECQSELAAKEVGGFDYECPSSKFLVISMGRLGLGAVMRLGVVNALIAGIASNRTVLVVNNSPTGPKFLREPWLLASCPRRDMQCFYMPMTPCVLTKDEIANATTLERGQARALFRSGRLPDHLEDERVVLMDIVLRPQRTPYAFRERTVQIIREQIIQPLKQQPDGAHPLVPLLSQAADNILEEEQLENGSYYYFGHNSKHNHALVFYAMRPNLKYLEKLDTIMHDVIPHDLDPDRTFGVPIRDSDKCEMESECLPFHQYMNMTRHTYNKYQAELLQPFPASAGFDNHHALPTTASIIVTSEAVQVHNAMAQYQDEGRPQRELPFSARFVSNSFDVRQGTGNPGRTHVNVSMDDVMLSAVSSLKAQLYARYTLGNCCSNFHLLLFDFLRDGCGAARSGQVAECMQDHEDPSFRLCCHWSKTEECIEKRRVSTSL
jgi:hypothetical protein